MTRSQFATVLLVAALSGAVAGGVVSWCLNPTQAEAQNSRVLVVTELRLVDAGGRTRALLSMMRDKPRLMMSDDAGEFRFDLGIGPDGEPALWLRDPEGRARAQLGLGGGGRPSLEFVDRAGNNRTSIGLAADGSPSLFFRDEKGRERLALWQERGEGGLALADGAGRPRAGLAFKDAAGASLAFYDERRKQVWRAP